MEFVSSWRHRLIGDWRLPASDRRTAADITMREDWKLASLDLVGAVRLLEQTAD